jgi:WD40 repeat protein
VPETDLAREPPRLMLDLAGAYGHGVAFAPKRPYLVCSDADGNVRFFHRETGQPIGVPLRLGGVVSGLRFQPGTDRFVVLAGDAAHLCGLPDPSGDVVSGGLDQRLRGLDFSPTGTLLAAVYEHDVEVFDTGTLRRVQYARRPGDSPLSAKFDTDPTRHRLFRGLRSGFDWLEVPDGQKAEETRLRGLGRLHRVALTPDGRGLLLMGERAVARYATATLKLEAAEPPAEGIPAGVQLQALAVRPDGGEVLVAFGRRVAFLHPETLKPVRDGWETGDVVLDAAYTPDGERVLVGRRDNTAELLDAATGTRVAAAMPHERAVPAVAVSPDGSVLLTGSRDGTARFWDAATGLPLASPLRHAGSVCNVAYSPGGEHVATGTDGGHVVIWDVPPPPAAGTLDELRERFGTGP